eukprot:s9935_g4.t1
MAGKKVSTSAPLMGGGCECLVVPVSIVLCLCRHSLPSGSAWPLFSVSTCVAAADKPCNPHAANMTSMCKPMRGVAVKDAQKVSHARVRVPVFFNAAQPQPILDAVTVPGLHVVTVPAAAGMVSAMALPNLEKNSPVCGFRPGTSEVSLHDPLLIGVFEKGTEPLYIASSAATGACTRLEEVSRGRKRRCDGGPDLLLLAIGQDTSRRCRVLDVFCATASRSSFLRS